MWERIKPIYILTKRQVEIKTKNKANVSDCEKCVNAELIKCVMIMYDKAKQAADDGRLVAHDYF